MRRRAAVSLIAVVSLSACATAGSPAESAPSSMAWTLQDVESEGAKLAFGTPGTDNVLVMLTCRPRSGEVALSLAGFDAPGRPLVILGSGKALTRLPAERVPGMAGVDLQAATTPRNRALQRFAGTGELIVGVGARRIALPAAERSASRRFVESCSV